MQLIRNDVDIDAKRLLNAYKMELIINYYAKRSRHTEVKKGIYNDALTLRNWFVDNLHKLLKKLTTAASRYFLYRVRSSIWQTCGEEDCAAGDCLSCLADDQNIVIAAAGRQLSQLLHQGGGGLQQHLLHKWFDCHESSFWRHISHHVNYALLHQ